MGRKRKYEPSASDMRAKPFACRLPIELHNALEGRAITEGISPSEVARNVLHQWLYGTAPGVNEGYYQGRGSAVQIAHYLIEKAFASLPSSYEELQELLEKHAAERAMQRGDRRVGKLGPGARARAAKERGE